MNKNILIAPSLLLLIASPVYSGGKPPPKVDPVSVAEQEQLQQQAQGQGQQQGQNATGGVGKAASTSGSESNSNSSVKGTIDGTGGDSESRAKIDSDDDVDISTENNSSNIVLVPNNNTEQCIRVYGIAFGKDGEAGAIGWPWRSKPCDLNAAAADAFAAGERELGWFWKCHNKHLFKGFRKKDMTDEQAIKACHDYTVGEVRNVAVIRRLREQIEFLQRERKIERERCSDEKERISERCWGGKKD